MNEIQRRLIASCPPGLKPIWEAPRFSQFRALEDEALDVAMKNEALQRYCSTDGVSVFEVRNEECLGCYQCYRRATKIERFKPRLIGPLGADRGRANGASKGWE